MNSIIDGDMGENRFSPYYKNNNFKPCPICKGIPDEGDQQPCNNCDGCGEVEKDADDIQDDSDNAIEEAFERNNEN